MHTHFRISYFLLHFLSIPSPTFLPFCLASNLQLLQKLTPGSVTVPAQVEKSGAQLEGSSALCSPPSQEPRKNPVSETTHFPAFPPPACFPQCQQTREFYSSSPSSLLYESFSTLLKYAFYFILRISWNTTETCPSLLIGRHRFNISHWIFKKAESDKESYLMGILWGFL